MRCRTFRSRSRDGIAVTRYVAGIDGGQTSTTAVIGNETGCVVGRGRAGPADEIGTRAEPTRLHDALRDALAEARSNAALDDGVEFDAIVAGVSGYEGRLFGKVPALPTAHLTLVHDAQAAHAGALGGAPGIVVIAGTGSVVYTNDAGREWTGGGWGYLFGDEGSAFWVARETLAALMRDADRRDAAGDEAQATCDFFGCGTLREIARAFYVGDITRDRLAAFAPVAMHLPLGRALAARGADRLAELVRHAVENGAAPTVSFVGGMFADAGFAETLAQRIRAACPGAHVIEPKYEPSIGALALAYREAGLGPFQEIRERK
jgi:glucosamine kinase